MKYFKKCKRRGRQIIKYVSTYKCSYCRKLFRKPKYLEKEHCQICNTSGYKTTHEFNSALLAATHVRRACIYCNGNEYKKEED